MWGLFQGVSRWDKDHRAVALVKDQWTLGRCRILLIPCGLHTFLSLLIFTILQVAFSVIFFSHEWERCDHSWKRHVFSWMFPPKILWALLRFLVWVGQLSLQTLGAVLIQCWQDQRQFTPISVNMLCWDLNAAVLKNLCLFISLFSFVKTGCIGLEYWPR